MIRSFVIGFVGLIVISWSTAARAVYEPRAVIWDAEPTAFVVSAYYAAIGQLPGPGTPFIFEWIAASATISNRPAVWSRILNTPAYKSTPASKAPKSRGVCFGPNQRKGRAGNGTPAYYQCHGVRSENVGCFLPTGRPSTPHQRITFGQALALIPWFDIYNCQTTSYDRSVCKRSCGIPHARANRMFGNRHFQQAVRVLKNPSSESASRTRNRRRIQELPKAATSKKQYCSSYALQAVAQAKKLQICGAKFDHRTDWHKNTEVHYRICMASSRPYAQRQHNFRRDHLKRNCNS